MGGEFNVGTLSLPNSLDTFISLRSGALELKVGAGLAVGGSVVFDPGGSVSFRVFGGAGLGGKGLAKMPLSVGVEQEFGH